MQPSVEYVRKELSKKLEGIDEPGYRLERWELASIERQTILLVLAQIRDILLKNSEAYDEAS